jgi:hypothetical protein
MDNNSLKPAFPSQIKQSLGLLTALLFTVNAQCLTPYQASYDANIDGWSTTLHRSLVQKNDGQWQLMNTASILFAGFGEQADFDYQNRITPRHYFYDNKFSKKRSKRIVFDWDKQIAVTRKGKNSVTLELPEKAFDLLSYQQQLQEDISNNSNFDEQHYTIVDAGRFKHYRVKKLGEEWIDTPAGKFLTVKLEQTRQDKDRRTLIWMAKDWQYLIIKLQRFEGKESDQQILLIQATLGEKPVTGQ